MGGAALARYNKGRHGTKISIRVRALKTEKGAIEIYGSIPKLFRYCEKYPGSGVSRFHKRFGESARDFGSWRGPLAQA